MMSSRSVRWALRCYPSWWRERYGDEVSAVSCDLVSEGRSAYSVSFSLVRGAIASWTQGRGMPRKYELWSRRTRDSIAAATLPLMLLAPLVVYATAGQILRSSSGGFVLWEGFDFFPSRIQAYRDAALVPGPPLTAPGRLILAAAFILLVSSLIALLLLFCGWTRLISVIARDPSSTRRKAQLLAWVPVWSVLIDVALAAAIAIVQPSGYYSTAGGGLVPTNGHLSALHALNAVFPIVSGVGWILSAIAIALAARMTKTDLRDLKSGRTVAVGSSFVLGLMAAASLVWGVSLAIQAHSAAHDSVTIVTYAHTRIWIPLSMAFVAAGVLSVFGTRSARTSFRVTSILVE
jgi:hypothetical protein